MAVHGFSEGDAKRIGRAVRQVERQPAKVELSGATYGARSPGVRIMLGTKDTSTWLKLSSKTVTLYAGPPATTGLPTNNVGTVVCWNIMADVTAHTAGHWVQMSNNGFAWYALGVECK